MKRKILSLLTALVMALSLLPASALAADPPGNDGAGQSMTLAKFVQAVEDGNGTYDGKGAVVAIAPAGGCNNTSATGHTDHTAKTENTPERIQFYSGTAYAQYQRFSDLTDVSISNVTFRLVAPTEDILVCGAWNTDGASVDNDMLDAELQLENTGSVQFTGCTFENVAVSPIASESAVSFNDCRFSGLGGYAVKDVNAPAVTVTESEFTDCSGGVYMSGGGTTATTYTSNIFTDIGGRGAIQFSDAGDYSKTTLSITGNTFAAKEGEDSGFLRQLNYSISQEQISQIAEGNQIPDDMMLTADSNDSNDQLPGGVNFTGNNTVFDGTNYYETLKAALEGIHKKDIHTLWCKPGADVGTMTHGHVCADLTVYGNGAYISGGERDFELDTYEDINSSTKGSDLTDDVILKVYNLNGAGVWGERHSAHTLTIYLENCKNMQRVYITGATGPNHITLKNCTFDGTATDIYKKANYCTVYSNAPGSITVENCSFTGIVAPINLNTDAVADQTQTISVTSCTFTDCATEDISHNDDIDARTYAAPIRVVSGRGAKSDLTVDSCTFTYSDGKNSCNGDILLGDGREDKTSYPVSASIVNTAAQVQIQNPGDRTTAANSGKVIKVAASAEPVSVSNVVAKINGEEYTTLAGALAAAGKMTGNVTVEIIGQADVSGLIGDDGLIPDFDLSGSGLTNLTIQGADETARIVSGVDGNDIDGDNPNTAGTQETDYRCPVISIKLPADVTLTVKNLIFPDDLLFDSEDGTVVVQDCVFNGAQSGYPQAKSISYLNNTFDFQGTAGNFYSGNAYPVWYKVDDAMKFVFTGNTVTGPRGVHIETRTTEADKRVNIQVDNNSFILTDAGYENKTIALQLVKHLNGDISFSNNSVDAYMGVCFFDGVAVKDGATLTVENNYLVDDCKLYGSSEWNQSSIAAADEFAQDIIDELTGKEGSTVTPGHTEHNYVNGVCTICGQAQPSTGGSSGSTRYTVSVPSDVENGKVTVSPSRASRGSTVTVTVTPDEGYELDTLTVTDSDGNALTLTDKGNGKYTFTMPRGAVSVAASFKAVEEEPQPSDFPFTDVAEGAWYYDAVAYAWENDLMTGTSATTFAPGVTTDRAMLATLLWRLEGSPSVDYLMDFDDVAEGLWYSEAVRWAASEGVVTGVGDGSSFAPTGAITREQMAVMLYRYAQYKDYDVTGSADLSGYADADSVSGWAEYAVEWAVNAGLISGTSATTLSPQGSATRAEVATILMRFVEAFVPAE